VIVASHPCHQVAHFLVHTRPPDSALPMICGRPRRNPGALHRQDHHRVQAFFVTRSSVDTMPGRQGSDDDEITLAPAAGGHAAGGASRAPTQLSDDLQSTLVDPLESYGTKMWGRHEVTHIDGTLVKFKDPGGLLTLRAQFLSSLGPQFLWIIMFSTVELASLTEEEKEMYTTMRMAFLTANCKRLGKGFAVLSLEDTEGHDSTFRPSPLSVHQQHGTSPSCGTYVWSRIFTLYPLAGAAITHKLLVSWLEKCMTHKDNSTDVFTTYIATVNGSVSQFDNMPAISVSDVYALVTLMGLHLSSSDRHEKVCRDLIAYVDEDNTLQLDVTLEKVYQVVLKILSQLGTLAQTFSHFQPY
jgi:hypothetical protein